MNINRRYSSVVECMFSMTRSWVPFPATQEIYENTYEKYETDIYVCIYVIYILTYIHMHMT